MLVTSRGSQLFATTFVASKGRQLTILKFNVTAARIRTRYWLEYAIVGFRRVLLEKVCDFAFRRWGIRS